MNPFLSPNTENRAWIFASGHLLSLILLCNSCAIIRAVLYCLLFGCTLGSPAAVRTQQLHFQTRQHSAVGRASQVLPPRPDMWVHACNPSTGKGATAGSLELTGQPTWLIWLAAGQWEILSQNIKVDRAHSSLLPITPAPKGPMPSYSTCTYMHIDTQRYT